MIQRKETIPRRTFIKLSLAVGIMAGIGPIAVALGTSGRCNYCKVDLLGNKILSRAGYCRNCGAEVYSGRRDLPDLSYSASERSGDNFKGMELPFPNLDIRQWTAKPCFSLQQIGPGISRVRKTRFQTR